MIEFNFETDFHIKDVRLLQMWITDVIRAEGFELGEISYVFCDDDFLHKLNLEFLNHDTLTDILSFEYSVGKQINGEIFISIERVAENAKDFEVSFEDELSRVMVHGVLHFCGYTDITDNEVKVMRIKENDYMAMLESLR